MDQSVWNGPPYCCIFEQISKYHLNHNMHFQHCQMRFGMLATWFNSRKKRKLRESGHCILWQAYSRRFRLLQLISAFRVHSHMNSMSSGKRSRLQNYEQLYTIDDRHLWAEPEDLRIKHHSNDSYFVSLPRRQPSGEIFTQIARITVSVSDV